MCFRLRFKRADRDAVFDLSNPVQLTCTSALWAKAALHGGIKLWSAQRSNFVADYLKRFHQTIVRI